MEWVLLDVPNGGQQCKYQDINVHDVVMSELPWLHGCGWKYLTPRLLHMKSYVKPFLVVKTHLTTTPQPPFVPSMMVKNIEYDIEAPANWPPKHRPAREATHSGQLFTFANMMRLPFKDSSSYIGKQGHPRLADISYFCWYQLGRLMGTLCVFLCVPKIGLTLSRAQRRKKMAKKSRKWRSHDPPPTQRICYTRYL